MTIRRTLAIGLAAASLVCFAPVPGCALIQRSGDTSTQITESQRYQVAAQLYIGVVNAMTRLATADMIDLDQTEAFERVRVTANSLLSDWRMAIVNGTKFDGLSALNVAIDEMVKAQAKAENKEFK